MTYCRRCILPDTRPGIVIGPSGVCNACTFHESRPTIDWAARERAFGELVGRVKSRGSRYDCLIPVSGGKDSTWQVVKCLEWGLRPLAVTWKSPARTAIGQANLDNLVGLGVDHIDYQINPNVERKFMRATIERHGSPAIPMHLGLFNIPLTLATALDIPLVVWGENSAFEYGGDEAIANGFKLDSAWRRTHGVTAGTTAEDWVSDSLMRGELTPYFGPSDEVLDARGVLAVFLGYYYPWDPQATYQSARAHGFRAGTAGARTGYYDFADIDDDFISVHHYLKWHKFGITRSFDNLSLEIRHGRLTRDQAIDWLRRRGDETPHDDIRAMCRFIDRDIDWFMNIAERFRNHDIWKRRNETWQIDGFLIPDWTWR
jgi:N-acetyl sugar amidotransferase